MKKKCVIKKKCSAVTKKSNTPRYKNSHSGTRNKLSEILCSHLFTITFVSICLIIVLPVCRYCIFPDIETLKKQNPSITSFMRYRQAQWRVENRQKTISQQWISYAKISPFLIRAVILSEDANFWKHEGFDFEAIQNAIQEDIRVGTFKFGASTISQQLAKNLFLEPSKNPIRKIKEAILTWRIERSLSKTRIIELYLNCVEWGDGIFGAEAAANFYFKKTAAQLNAKEASQLAAVLPNPLKFNPLSSSRYVVRRSTALYKSILKQKSKSDYRNNAQNEYSAPKSISEGSDNGQAKQRAETGIIRDSFDQRKLFTQDMNSIILDSL